MIRELRYLIAVKMIGWAVTILPKSNMKSGLSKWIVEEWPKYLDE